MEATFGDVTFVGRACQVVLDHYDKCRTSGNREQEGTARSRSRRPRMKYRIHTSADEFLIYGAERPPTQNQISADLWARAKLIAGGHH
jgi:hypothetical protein